MDARSREFQNYSSGILAIENCSCVNHAVTVVALQNDNDGLGDYLKVINSWGADWGDQGYFKIRLESSCFITDYAFLPRIKKASPAPPKSEYPILFKGSNYTGTKLDVPNTIPNLEVYKFSALASSVRRGKYAEARLYSSSDCKGYELIIKEDKSNLDYYNFTYNTRSIVVDKILSSPPSGCVWVYEECCFSGAKKELCGSIANLNTINFNNKISAFRFADDILSISLYFNTNYTGTGYKFSQTFSCIAQGNSNAIDKKATSVKIVKKKQ